MARAIPRPPPVWDWLVSGGRILPLPALRLYSSSDHDGSTPGRSTVDHADPTRPDPPPPTPAAKGKPTRGTSQDQRRSQTQRDAEARAYRRRKEPTKRRGARRGKR